MNVAEWPDSHRERDGDYDAVIAGDRVWTQAALHDRACRLAQAFVSLGLRPGERVLLLLANRVELIVAFEATLRSGGVAVPLFAGASPTEIARIIDLSQPVAIVTSPELVATFDAARLSMRIVTDDGACPPAWQSFDALIDAYDPLARAVPRESADPAIICYTSGSSGLPKGVVHTHGSIDARHGGATRALPSRVLVALPLGTLGASALTGRLAHKHTLILLDAFEPRTYLAAIARHRITKIVLVPSMGEAIAALPDLDTFNLSSLSTVSFTGADVPPALLARLSAVLPVNPSIAYGMTETGGGIAATGLGSKPGSVGRVLKGVDLRIVDEDDRERATGEVGEIIVRTPWMGAGYYQQPDETATGFANGWIRTGDLGYLDADRELFLVGRRKDLISQGGVKIAPRELIDVLRRLDAIAESAIVGLPHALLGEQVVACVVRRADAAIEAEEIIAHCRAHLEPRKVPVRVRFLEALPRTPTHKVDIAALRQQLLDTDTQIAAGAGIETELARKLRGASALQERIALLRATVEACIRKHSRPSSSPLSDGRGHAQAPAIGSLGLPAERGHAQTPAIGLLPLGHARGPAQGAADAAAAAAIDPNATFGELGLDSIRLAQLAHALGDALGRTVAPTIFFSYPTVDALCRRLAEDVTNIGSADAPVHATAGVIAGAPARAHANGGANTNAPANVFAHATTDTVARESAPRTSRRSAAAPREAIAIVGAGCRLPGGVENPEQFWAMLRDGVDATSEIARWNLDGLYDPTPGAPGRISTRRAALLDEPELFDADFFGLSRREAQRLDPQHRLVLEVTWEAIEQAGYDPTALAESRAGLFLGISGGSIAGGMGTAPSMAVGRVCHFLDLRGPAIAIDTWCSSSLAAVHSAVQSLRLGECDFAIAGGVQMIASPRTFIGPSEMSLLAADGRCKAFDARADGFGRGEGCVMLVLKRLSHAQRDDDRIIAIIRGTALRHDGRSSSLTAPNGRAQQDVMRAALEDAAIAPGDLDYLEAHGTGTPLGDPIEVEAAVAVLGDPSRPLRIGSVKTNIGHLEAAAGAAGLLKTALALNRGAIPAHLHCERFNPLIEPHAAAIAIPRVTEPWPETPGRRRIAGVTSMGLSGTNVHVILEEAPPPAPAEHDGSGNYEGHESDAADAREAAGEPQLLCLSARTDEALRQLARCHAERLTQLPLAQFADYCFTANTGRARLARRLCLIAATPADARAQLQAYADGRAPASSAAASAAVATTAMATAAAAAVAAAPRPDTCAQPRACADGRAAGLSAAASAAVAVPATAMVTPVAAAVAAAPPADARAQLQAYADGPAAASSAAASAAVAVPATAMATPVAAAVAAAPPADACAQLQAYADSREATSSELASAPVAAPTTTMVAAGAAAVAAAPPSDARVQLQAYADGPAAAAPATAMAYAGGRQLATSAVAAVDLAPTPRLAAIAERYQRGLDPNWRELYGGRRFRRLALPAYPFQRQRYRARTFDVDPRESSFANANANANARAAASSPAAGAAVPDMRPAVPLASDVMALVRRAIAEAVSCAADSIAGDQDCLELGLDSLGVFDVVSAVREKTGIACTPADFMDRPNIAAFTAFIVQRAALPAASTAATTTTVATSASLPALAPASAPAPRPRSPLVVLNDRGTRTPLFCPHPSGGRITAYLRFRTLLGDDQPLYALQSRAIDDPDLEYHTVDAMAADYAWHIQKARPDGPYRLAGWSMGAVVSLAIAAALERQGARVEMVGLMDGIWPAAHARPSKLEELSFIIAALSADLQPSRDPSTWLAADVESARSLDPADLLAWSESRGWIEPGTLTVDAFDRMCRLYRQHFAILRDHQPPIIDAPIVEWRASARRRAYDWSRHSRHGATVHIIGGTHFSVMRSPRIERIASDLEAYPARHADTVAVASGLNV